LFGKNLHFIIFSSAVNWGSFWLEMCPEPPFQLMTLIEELLQKFGPGALNILKKNSINIVSYAWPLFETGFSCCLPEKSWRQLWDHVVCNKTAFFVSAVVAFICCTEPLMQEPFNFKVE
jgi:Rab-GTPase-TBC domain